RLGAGRGEIGLQAAIEGGGVVAGGGARREVLRPRLAPRGARGGVPGGLRLRRALEEGEVLGAQATPCVAADPVVDLAALGGCVPRALGWYLLGRRVEGGPEDRGDRQDGDRETSHP